MFGKIVSITITLIIFICLLATTIWLLATTLSILTCLLIAVKVTIASICAIICFLLVLAIFGQIVECLTNKNIL